MQKITNLVMKKKGVSIDAKALNRLAWFGFLIKEYRKKRDEYKFVLALIDNLKDNNKVHIPIKTPGTVSGRCSAGAMSS